MTQSVTCFGDNKSYKNKHLQVKISFSLLSLTDKLDFILSDLLLEAPEFPQSKPGRDDEQEEGGGHDTNVAARVEQSSSEGEGDGPGDRPTQTQHGQSDHSLPVRNNATMRALN